MTGRMPRRLELGALRATHRIGAWIFDRSGPAAPHLAAIGERLSHGAFPRRILTGDEPITVDGFRIHHEGRTTFHAQMLAMGMHDRDVTSALRSFAKTGMSIVDVGAHLGWFALQSARIVGTGGRVFAFEPSPDLLPLLRRTVADNRLETCVEVIPSAVGDAVGPVTLYPGEEDSMLTSIHAAAASASDAASVTDRVGDPPRGATVACTTLDVWFAEHDWPPVDLVKIDVEGHEVAVLRGMTALAHRQPGLAVIIEFNERTLAAAGESVASFADALATCGWTDIRIAGARGRSIDLIRDARHVAELMRRRGTGTVNLVARRAG
jgi:FkbM family methyltransferase